MTESETTNASAPAPEPAAVPTAEPPQWMADLRSKSTDAIFEDLNRVPLFMNTLDETDGEGGENVMLEAIKALQYEGTPEEVALNFKEQGNDCFRAKQYNDAVEYYTKAIAVKCGDTKLDGDCYANRALCQIYKRNYGSAIRDCKAALMRDEKNVKAWYRAAKAGFELGKVADARECAARGLKVEPENKALLGLIAEIEKKEAIIAKREKERQEREEHARKKKEALELAFKARNVVVRHSKQKPDMDDAEIHLENELDAASHLIYPLLVMYPVSAQSDFIKEVVETSSVGVIVDMVLQEPPVWDSAREYNPKKVETYMETKTGGLIKVGRKLMLAEILGNGKVEIVDGVVKMFMVPKTKVDGFIAEWKKRKVA